MKKIYSFFLAIFCLFALSSLKSTAYENMLNQRNKILQNSSATAPSDQNLKPFPKPEAKSKTEIFLLMADIKSLNNHIDYLSTGIDRLNAQYTATH